MKPLVIVTCQCESEATTETSLHQHLPIGTISTMADSEVTKNSNASIASLGRSAPSITATVDTTFKANVYHVYLLGRLIETPSQISEIYLFCLFNSH